MHAETGQTASFRRIWKQVEAITPIYIITLGSIFIYIIVISVLAGRKGQPMFELIEDFQTLITGILAVGAAYFTIYQMRQSDIRADIRHNAVMKLSLKADYLIVRRAIFPQVQEIEQLEKDLGQLADAIDKDGIGWLFSHGYVRYLQLTSKIRGTLNKQQLTDVLPLLPPATYWRIQELRDIADSLEKTGDMIKYLAELDTPLDELSDELRSTYYSLCKTVDEEASGWLRTVVEILENVRNELIHLEQQYARQIQHISVGGEH